MFSLISQSKSKHTAPSAINFNHNIFSKNSTFKSYYDIWDHKHACTSVIWNGNSIKASHTHAIKCNFSYNPHTKCTNLYIYIYRNLINSITFFASLICHLRMLCALLLVLRTFPNAAHKFPLLNEIQIILHKYVQTRYIFLFKTKNDTGWFNILLVFFFKFSYAWMHAMQKKYCCLFSSRWYPLALIFFIYHF
jgi:hypothetical protein